MYLIYSNLPKNFVLQEIMVVTLYLHINSWNSLRDSFVWQLFNTDTFSKIREYKREIYCLLNVTFISLGIRHIRFLLDTVIVFCDTKKKCCVENVYNLILLLPCHKYLSIVNIIRGTISFYTEKIILAQPLMAWNIKENSTNIQFHGYDSDWINLNWPIFLFYTHE